TCGLLQWNADIPVRIHPEMRVSPLLTCGLAQWNADIPVRIHPEMRVSPLLTRGLAHGNAGIPHSTLRTRSRQGCLRSSLFALTSCGLLQGRSLVRCKNPEPRMHTRA
ncbi:MAG: hypothetical protein ACRD6X_12265, partial [Pyrinomonadaceae bacterium]